MKNMVKLLSFLGLLTSISLLADKPIIPFLDGTLQDNNVDAAKRWIKEQGIDSKNDAGETLLYWASRYGDEELVDFLVAQGAKMNEGQGPFRWTPLFKAAQYNHVGIAKKLIAHGAEVNYKDIEGDTPLHLAAFYDAKDTADVLIQGGAKIHNKNSWKNTPLDIAMQCKRKNMARFLLELHLKNTHEDMYE